MKADSLIAKFGSSFTVEEIMVPVIELRRADSVEDACRLREDFDIVPFPREGFIAGYFDTETEEEVSLARQDLISSDTSLRTAVSLLSERRFRFVLSADRIAGMVHRSDLSKPAVALLCFTLCHLLEKELWDAFQLELEASTVRRVLGEERWDKLTTDRIGVEAERLDNGFQGLLYFSDLLKLAVDAGLIDLSSSECSLIVKFRNRVVHPDQPLVSSNGVRGLDKALNILESSLEYLTSRSDH